MPTPNHASWKTPSRISALMLAVLAASMLQAQVRIVTAGGVQPRQPLNIPPSVTSIENHVPPYMPNAPASVTSISPYNFNTYPYTSSSYSSNYGYRYGGRYNNCRGRGCGYGSYGYGYGYGYAVPYYYIYPADDSGSYGSGGAGPYLYSGPPQGGPPAEQTLHIIIDSAPQRAAPRDEIADEQPARPVAQASIPDAKPGVPTILVFRDGHKQDVTNYAIMGQTLYVFDSKSKKIALADLDVPATIKANDDEGVEFQVPKAKQSSKPANSTGVPLQSAPDESPKSSTSSMTATP